MMSQSQLYSWLITTLVQFSQNDFSFCLVIHGWLSVRKMLFTLESY